jgi:DNA-binding beta-propeller fold protein YncE
MKKTVILALMLIVATAQPGISSTGKQLYVVNSFMETLSRIDLTEQEVYNDILMLGSIPNDLVIEGEMAYVVNSGTNDLYEIDLPSEIISRVIDLGTGNNPWAIVFYSDDVAYVSNWLTDTVSKVDIAEGRIAKTVNVGIAPEGMVIAGDLLYVANTGWNGSSYDEGSVSVIDLTLEEVIETITVGMNPQELILDPQGEINVICTGDYFSTFGEIHCVDPLTLETTEVIRIGGTPARAACSGIGEMFIAAGGWIENGEVYLHDTLTNDVLHGQENPICIGPGAMDVAVDSEDFMYAASFLDNSVSVFALPDTFVRNYQVGGGPVAIGLYETPWIEIDSAPVVREVHRGETMRYTVDVTHRGEEQAYVKGATYLVLPGGTFFPDNPLHGPRNISLSPGDEMHLTLQDPVPEYAPAGRYVLFSIGKESGSKRKTVGSFWFEVVP